ncbi:hypothetical protein V6N11_064587 [Hibiscus sabdariffa]
MCFIILSLLCYPLPLKGNPNASPFPSNFLFGTASSSYQFEGAFLSDGKGLNNWDIFTHKPGNIMDGSNGDIAVDHYHRYQEDLDLMQHIGVNSYRFSISWARILPKGRFGSVNKAGIMHYNKLINTFLLKGHSLVSTSPLCYLDSNICIRYASDTRIITLGNFISGIQPFVSLTHYDIPQELENRYGAWLSPQVQTKYQKQQGGSIGIVMNAVWYEPISNSLENKQAAERAQAFYMNWFLDPIIKGKYPEVMQEILGSNLPAFSNHDQGKLKSTGLDFIGINHYTSFYIRDCMFSVCEEKPGTGSSKTEGFVLRTSTKDGVSIGEPTALDWLYVYPQGMEKIITYIKERYNNIPMFITENGFCENDKSEKGLTEESLNDVKRVEYISGYLGAIAEALRKGADIRGYFLWSLLDNFEWTLGFTVRFGLHHVDLTTLKRIPRASASWYRQFIANHTAPEMLMPEHVPGSYQRRHFNTI